MKKKILFVLCLLTGLMFLNAGLNKIFNYIPVPTDLPEPLMKANAAFMTIGWLLPLVAAAEIIGGVLFVINRFRALGAIILFPVILGILLVHITVAQDGIPMALVIFAVIVWAMFENREKLLPMVRK